MERTCLKKVRPSDYRVAVQRMTMIAGRAACNRWHNLVPRAFSSTIFKMADRRKKTLVKAGSCGTKSPNILEIFITSQFEKSQHKMAAEHRERSKAPVKERFNFVHQAWWLCSKIIVIVTDVLILQQDFWAIISLFALDIFNCHWNRIEDQREKLSYL